jgi:hypothetical protein
MNRQNVNKTGLLVSSMMEIYNFLKSRGVQNPNGDDLGFLHWKNHPMNDEQKRIRELMDGVLKTIKDQNQELSDLSIYECLLFDLTQKVIWFPDDYPDIEAEYRKMLNHLLDYTARREIDVPIVNLRIDDKPVVFGLATFFRFEDSDKNGDWWETIQSTAGGVARHIYSFARLRCAGDAVVALESASNLISETLNILRAIGSPLKSEPSFHFGLVNEFQLFQTRPYRHGKPEESYSLIYQPSIVRVLGPGIAECQLEKDVLDTIEKSNLDKLQKLIENEFLNPRTKMTKKLFLGLHWLGEATKPDTSEAKFAKLTFALEALIGGDAGNNTGNLSTRGLTAALAERCAFLVGESQSNRQEVHDRIHKYYGIRSGIVHGGDKKIMDDELVGFATIIRGTVWAIVRNLNLFKDVDDLQKWILKQRYSLL